MAGDSIPLLCNICPKKPTFSDVSHLLTHIASKGHLSHYYKVKIASTHEAASRLLIDAYDRWYAEWNVEDLMSQRMSQRDKQRTRAKPSGRTAAVPRIEAPVPRPARRAAVGSLLDPRLSEQQPYIKSEPSPSPPPMGRVLRHRPSFVPRMQQWTTTDSRASSRSYTNQDYDTSSEYSDPSDRRRYRPTASNSCAIEDDTPAVDPMAVTESTKLKGVYWPGMAIFDSATPEMRRKRNQKKDNSVVMQLEVNSQEVEANELIFSPRGSFKRSRRISCSESDEEGDLDTDIKLESPPVTKRRPALQNLDVNVAHRFRHLNQPTVLTYPARNHYEDDMGHQFPANNPRDRPTKRKRFEVFQDDEEDPFSQQPGANYLAPRYLYQHSPSPAPVFPAFKSHQEPLHFEPKENMHPVFHQPPYGNMYSYQGGGYLFAGPAYPLGHEVFANQFVNHLGHNFEEGEDDDDDQRTLTAPPSPATT